MFSLLYTLRQLTQMYVFKQKNNRKKDILIMRYFM